MIMGTESALLMIEEYQHARVMAEIPEASSSSVDATTIK
jgi:hypothetical protein